MNVPGIHPTRTWEVWQDSPDYGCDDNPSFKWFTRGICEGNIVQILGPFENKERAAEATQDLRR